MTPKGNHIRGACLNVLTNLEGITDGAFKAETLDAAAAVADRARKKMKAVLEILDGRQGC